MARDEHGNVIRHQTETEDDENLTEDEASSYSRQPKTRTGHTSKFPLITGDPSDMTHRQKKMHFKMLLSHIQGSALYEQIADIFTKGLGERQHTKLRALLTGL